MRIGRSLIALATIATLSCISPAVAAPATPVGVYIIGTEIVPIPGGYITYVFWSDGHVDVVETYPNG